MKLTKIFTKLSKALHIVILFSFFLPFYSNSCSRQTLSAEDKAKFDSIKRDSIERVKKDSISVIVENERRSHLPLSDPSSKPVVRDSVNPVSEKVLTASDSIILISDSLHSLQRNTHGYLEVNPQPSKYLSSKSILLRWMLRPNGDLSGLGYIIDGFAGFVMCYGIILSFFLLIFGLILVFLKTSHFWLIGVLSLISLAGLYCSIIPTLNGGVLWGFWFCLIEIIVLIIIDFTLAIKTRKGNA